MTISLNITLTLDATAALMLVVSLSRLARHLARLVKKIAAAR
nr:MAG TPA: hypothetical protein [Caudoviricetes sp.]